MVVDLERRVARQARRVRLQAQHGSRAGDQERLPRLPHPHRERPAAHQHLPGQRLVQHRAAEERRADLRLGDGRSLRARHDDGDASRMERRGRGRDDEASRYLRRGDPDAGFVYLGLVDETAHLVGSALPPYAASIATTDARIGRILNAIRSRPSYPFEAWTVLVTTDHGQRPFDFPSVASHIGGTPLEETSFVFGAGPGLGKRSGQPKIVDIAPTVLHQLGIGVPASWNLDGRSLSAARPPASAQAAVVRRGLLAHVTLGVPRRAVGAAAAASGRRAAGPRSEGDRRRQRAPRPVRRGRPECGGAPRRPPAQQPHGGQRAGIAQHRPRRQARRRGEGLPALRRPAARTAGPTAAARPQPSGAGADRPPRVGR